MRYEKATAEVVSFDGHELFMANSALVAQYGQPKVIHSSRTERTWECYVVKSYGWDSGYNGYSVECSVVDPPFTVGNRVYCNPFQE